MVTLSPSLDIRIPGGDLPLKVLSSDEGSSITLPFRSLVVSPMILDSQWVFPLTKDSFQDLNGMTAPIVRSIEAIFPVGFVPNRKAKRVSFRFENEDGSFWGGEEVDLVAQFNEFFGWEWTDSKGLSHPNRWHRPAWLTLRAWQLVRSQVSRRNWDYVEPKDLTIEILQTRKDYFDGGMYQEHGFPVRLVLTLE
jgi:hypothetical protein